MYQMGRGVPKDSAKAIEWFTKAAMLGFSTAQFNLGFAYGNGEGVAQDYSQAMKWYRLAAVQGLADAQFNLGLMYANGQGVPQDDISAHLWLNLAASQGDEDARKYRDLVSARMTPDQIAEAQRLEREWKPNLESP